MSPDTGTAASGSAFRAGSLTVVMLADGSPGWPAVEAHVPVYVADVDESYRRALAAGGKVLQPRRRAVAASVVSRCETLASWHGVQVVELIPTLPP